MVQGMPELIMRAYGSPCLLDSLFLYSCPIEFQSMPAAKDQPWTAHVFHDPSEGSQSSTGTQFGKLPVTFRLLVSNLTGTST